LAGKEYELLFRLKAVLGNDFNRNFQKAAQTTKQLQNTLSQLNSVQGKIDGYLKQSNAAEKNRLKLEELKTAHDKLQQEMKQTEQPSEALKKKFEQNASQIEKTTAKIKEQETRLEALGNELKAAGVDTNNLEAANKRLGKSYESVKASQERIAAINVAQQKNAEVITQTKGQLMATLGVLGAIGVAIYAGPVKSAIKFESSMADVAKVVEGLKDSTTGKLTADYYALRKEISDLSTQIPYTTEELAKIAAAAGQAGIARKEIGKFTTDAAKMGIAFDTTADQAGDWLAKWRTSFGMTQPEVVALADKINYLGNNSAANARQISEIVTKIGPLGEVAGLASGEIAGLGATLVAVGVQEDVAATGIKKVITTMTAGAAATKRQTEVLDKLGFSATELAQRMQKDAKGAILDFMEAVKKLPQAEQAAALKDFFGEESVAAIAPLLTKTDLLAKHWNMVGDATLYAGSMEQEYATRAGTTENKIQLAKNSIEKLSRALGDALMPSVGDSAEKLSELVTKLADFVEKNPELIRTIAKITAGLIGFKIAGLGAKLVFHEIKGAGYAASKVIEIFRGKAVLAGAESVGLGAKLTKTGSGLKSFMTQSGSGIKAYFSSLHGAFGSLLGGTKIGNQIGRITAAVKGGMFNALLIVQGKAISVFTGISGKAINIFSGIGRAVIAGPLGKMWAVIGGQFGRIKIFLAPITNLLLTAFSPLGKLAGFFFGGFGGIFGKLFPIVGVITLIIAAVQIFRNKLDEIRGFIQRVFGDAGLEAFDKFIAVVTKVGNAVKGVFSGEGIQGIRDFINKTFGDNPALANFFNGFVTVFGGIGNLLLQFIRFIDTNVTPIIQGVFDFIVGTVLPLIAQKFAEWAPTIMSIIQGIWTVISTVAGLILQVIQFIGPTIGDIISTTLNTIVGIIGGALQVIKGIVDIFAGIFTGDWQRVWEGVKSIFSGVWEAIKAIIKAPLNFIIAGLNTFIRGVNKIQIPDWVPGVGGKSLSIPEIPAFAKGTNKTPETFIAGERGAELITNAKNRTVFNALQTKNIFNTIAKVKEKAATILPPVIPPLQFAYAYAGVPAQTVEPVKVQAADSSRRAISVEVRNQPVIHIDGNKPEDLEEKLERNNQGLINAIMERIRREKENERRGKYE
jgi:TP901 family phage tail tape measure protein